MANATKTVKSSGGDYTSLNAALAGQAANLTTNCAGTGGAGILTIECYAMSDTTAANTGTGYTTSADYYINITVPTAERHVGKWNGDKYNLITTADSTPALTIAENYTRCLGLQLSQNGGYNSRQCLKVNNLTGIIVDSCILKIGGTGGASSESFSTSCTATYSVVVVNTIAINPLHTGFQAGEGGSPSVVFYNCTAVSCAYKGFDSYSGRTLLKNCVAHSSGNSDYNKGMGDAASTNNASEDGSAPNTKEVDLSGDTLAELFTDAANGDFSLVAGCSLVNTGIDLSADGYAANTTLASSKDIAGQTRSTWDIGAWEYVAAGASSTPSFQYYFNNARQ